MTFARGTLGLDSARSSQSLGIATAKQTGAQFWLRYVAGQGDNSSDSQFKLLTPGEIGALAAGGISGIVNMEWSEDRLLSGHASGLADAQTDLPRIAAQSYRPGASVYLSLEPGRDPAEEGQLDDYYAGYNQGLQGQYVADGGYFGIPLLKSCMAAGFVKKGWIPESTDASEIPADHQWIYMPTKDQLGPAMSYLDTLIAGAPADCTWIWQNGNKWFVPNAADENIVLVGGNLGSHLEDGIVPPPAPPAPVVVGGPHFMTPWPGGALGFQQHDYFGDIDGPRASHGGYYANEQGYIAMIQDRLLWLGVVGGRSYPNPGWADGIFNMKDHLIGGPTSDAVSLFQHIYRPNGTTEWGKFYSDDWATLFSLTK